MSADSLHHKVEQGMKKKTRVEDFQDFVDLENACGKSFVVDYQGFLLVPRGVSQGKYASKKPKLENFQVVMFKSRSDKIFWNTRHSQEQFHETQFLQKKYIKSSGNDFKYSEQPLGVKTARKEEIVSILCPFLKPSRRHFWEDLPINDDSIDPLTDRDQSEHVDYSC